MTEEARVNETEDETGRIVEWKGKKIGTDRQMQCDRVRTRQGD